MKIRIHPAAFQSSKGRVLPPNALASPNCPRSCHRPPSSGPCRIQHASKRPRVTSPSSPASSKQAARRCGWLSAGESFRKWYLDEAILWKGQGERTSSHILSGGNAKKHEKAKNNTHINWKTIKTVQAGLYSTMLFYVLRWISIFEAEFLHQPDTKPMS